MNGSIRLGVIGDPIAHSMSPRIFKFLIEKIPLDDSHDPISYEALHVPKEKLAEFVQSARKTYRGLNVTIPHKEAIKSLLDNLTPQASSVGAVNCIDFSKGAAGHNTDVWGFVDSLHSNGFEPRKCNVLVIGSGGAARAVAYALGSEFAANVFVLNRNLSAAKKLAEQMQLGFPDTNFNFGVDSAKIEKKIHLVINTTPLGMFGVPGTPKPYFTSIFGTTPFAPVAYAMDLIYKPAVTPFLELARELGFKTIGGKGMLASQAIASWEIWFGPIKNRIETKLNLEAALDRWVEETTTSDRIFLTGFMGVGKSTVGAKLAQFLGWRFIDTDQEIEKRLGRSINEIFKEGETSFRNTEEMVVREVCRESKAVISLGGGALNRSDVRSLVKGSGSVVYLSATESELIARLGPSVESRPLLRHSPFVTLKDHVSSLLASRKAIYREAAVEIATDQMNAEQVVAKIVQRLGLERI